jgi:hypothetical protein
MLAHNLIKIFASCYIVGASAREEGDFPVDFHLKILAYPDDKDIRAKKLMDKESKAMVQVGSDETLLWCDGAIDSFAPYPDKPDDQYLQLNELIFSRGSPDPQIVKVSDATDGETQTIVSCCSVRRLSPRHPLTVRSAGSR